jgi:hypothetical protein
MYTVSLDAQNRMYLRTAKGKMSLLMASLLEKSIAGFKAGEKTSLKVSYLDSDKSVYHRYEGGPIWMATTPFDIGRPGREFTINVGLLTRGEFISNIPSLL